MKTKTSKKEIQRSGAEPAVVFNAVTYAYPKSSWATLTGSKQHPAVQNISFNVARGASVGLIGESGSGKSTIAKLILDFATPDTGIVEVFGSPPSDHSQRSFRRSVQPVFQDPIDALDPRIPVGSQLAEPLIVQQLCSRDDLRKQIDRLLARVGLDSAIAGRLPHQISGGQAQRIVIARALAVDPLMLVCDEPVSALDMSIQSQILNLFKELRQELHLTYFFISHDLRAVSYLCDEILVIYHGTIVEQGSTGNVIENPAHPYTHLLLSALPKSGREQKNVDRPPPYRESVIDPETVSTGCAFAPRCHMAERPCFHDPPCLIDISPDHKVACPITVSAMSRFEAVP